MKATRIQVWCDVGGTFTDCILRRTDGTIQSLKVLSHGAVQGVLSKVNGNGAFAVTGRKTDPESFGWVQRFVFLIGLVRLVVNPFALIIAEGFLQRNRNHLKTLIPSK